MFEIILFLYILTVILSFIYGIQMDRYNGKDVYLGELLATILLSIPPVINLIQLGFGVAVVHQGMLSRKPIFKAKNDFD